MANNLNTEKKYHVSKDGVLRPCPAKIQCRLNGGFSMHFTNPEEGQNYADALNKLISEGTDYEKELTFVKMENGVGYGAGKESLRTLARIQTVDILLKHMETAQKNAREQIMNRMSRDGVHQIKTEDGVISRAQATTRNNVSEEAVKKAGLFDQYSKDSNVSEYVELDHNTKRKADRNFISAIKTQTSSVSNVNISFSKDKDGNKQLSKASVEKINNYIAFENSIAELKAAQKIAKSHIMEKMKEQNLKEVKGLNGNFVYHAPTTRKIVDVQKLKDAGLYDNYLVKNKVKRNLRIKSYV